MSSGKDPQFDAAAPQTAGPFAWREGELRWSVHAWNERSGLFLREVESAFVTGRLPSAAASPAPERRHVLVVTRGSGLLVRGGAVETVGSGDVVLFGDGGDTRFALSRCSVLLASVERAALPFPSRIPRDGSLLLHGRSLEARVTRFLLSSTRDDRPPEAAIVTRLLTALDVAATTLRLGRAGRVAENDPLADRLLAAVDGATGQRPTDPASIAEAVGISRATLYRMTERFGGVEAFMRARRLDLSLGAILDAGHASDGIKGIALRHGFATAAHYSRSFRARFAMSPSEARRLAATGPLPEASRRDDDVAAMRRLREALEID